MDQFELFREASDSPSEPIALADSLRARYPTCKPSGERKVVRVLDLLGEHSMPYRHAAVFALLLFLVPPHAAPQSPENIDADCVLACLFDKTDLPPNCDCQAVDVALSNSTPAGGYPSLDSVRTGSDLVYEAKAQYDARMADVDDYYFVEQSFVFIPPGMNVPGTGVAQMAGVVPTMPLVRFFMGELGPDGEKRFNEVPPADLARMQSEASGQENPLADIDPSEMIGAFAAAMEGIAGMAPGSGGPGGDILRGLSGMAGGKLREVEAGVLGMENSEDGFGGNNVTDGFGLALEQELIDNLNLGQDAMGIPTYTARYFPRQAPWARFATTPVLEETGPSITSCISRSCGATQESYEEVVSFMQFISGDYALRNDLLLGYLIWLDARDNPREIFWEGRTFRLQYAELWLMSVNGQLAILGGDEELVPARRRIEYAEYDSTLDVVTDKIVIDTYSEGFDPDSAILAPSSSTSQIQGMESIQGFGSGGLMRVKKLFSRLSVNAGPPSAAEVAALMADTMPTSLDDPLTDDTVPTAQPTGSPTWQPSTVPPDLQPQPGPARQPLIRPGGGSPVVRDDIPVIERPNN